MIRIDPTIAHLCAGSLSLLWISAAVHKLRALDHYRAALDDYRLLPNSMVRPVSVLLPLIELGIGIGLLQMRSSAAIASFTVLTVYSLAITINLVRGRRDLDCGCGGPAFHQALSEGLVLRNGILACTSAVLLLPVLERALTWRDVITTVLGILSITLVYVSANQLLATAHPPSRSGWWAALGSGNG